MLYSKCCKEFTDMSFYIKLAKCFLEDDDEETKMYRGAEHHGRKYPRHGMQARYDDYSDYDEESRRRRYYRSEDENFRYDDYRNEESRRYRNEYENYDSRYRDNRVGFN
jgi:hypothetical protein